MMKTKVISILSGVLLLTTLTTTTLSAKQPQAKPFLIQGKLPHLTMMVKILWDDEDLALTKAQKEKLIIIRQDTMSGAKALGKKIKLLEAKIVKRSFDGVNPSTLKDDVTNLASMRAKATMIHLDCIYNTRAVLTKDQLYVLE